MAADPETVRAAELRVLQVIPILAMGGLERVATSLTLGLRPLVARVAVAGCTGVKELGSVEIEKPLRDGGVTIYHIPRAQRRLIDVLRAGIALVPVYRRERPDVVHAHNPSGGAAASLARILSLRLSTTIVTTYHGVEPQRLARATRVLSLTSDLVVGVGPTATRALERIGLPTDRSATVYNACSVPSSRGAEDIRREFAVPVDAELVVTVGRYSPEKNQALLLEALARLLPERPRLRALMVGVGPLERELRAMTVALGIEDSVSITGPRSDAHDIISAADIFVLSSASEGLPLVLLEAMALGVPTLSTSVGGVGDAVVDGETGLLVPPDDAEGLAKALKRLLDDRPLRLRLAASARAWAEATCTEETMIARYVELYVRAVSRRRRGRRHETAAASER